MKGSQGLRGCRRICLSSSNADAVSLALALGSRRAPLFLFSSQAPAPSGEA